MIEKTINKITVEFILDGEIGDQRTSAIRNKFKEIESARLIEYIPDRDGIYIRIVK